MPNGKVHARCSLYLTAPSILIGAIGGYLAGGPMGAFVGGGFCGLGCLLGVPLTPDLDQEAISTVEYQMAKWTMGLGFVWVILWFPYARMCAHRGVSHWPIIGTAGRLLYIAVWLFAAYLLGLRIEHWPLSALAWVVVGLVISDTAHWALDNIYGDPFDRHCPSYHKRHQRR